MFFCLGFLMVAVSLLAQHSPQEIKKHKISKIIKLSRSANSETVSKTETWYDSNGNDTAEYNNGELYRRTKYEYNLNDQPITRVWYNAEGNEMETTIYSYKPDGSCTISNTDKNFGTTELIYCDKTGKILRAVQPDGSERLYTYDRRGRLLQLKSKRKENGRVVIDQQYSYNNSGKLSKVVSKGDYKWTQIHSYGANGLLSKTRINSITDGVMDPEVIYSYEYEFRKNQ